MPLSMPTKPNLHQNLLKGMLSKYQPAILQSVILKKSLHIALQRSKTLVMLSVILRVKHQPKGLNSHLEEEVLANISNDGNLPHLLHLLKDHANEPISTLALSGKKDNAPKRKSQWNELKKRVCYTPPHIPARIHPE